MADEAADLTLYSTSHCQLCDDAEALLHHVPELVGRWVEVVDIAESDVLVERFGDHIPVLRSQRGQFLYWPFDIAQVRAFVVDFC